MQHAAWNRAEYEQDVLTDTPVLLKGGAKTYHKGSGWYAIMGYAADGSDVDEALDLIYDWGTP